MKDKIQDAMQIGERKIMALMPVFRETSDQLSATVESFRHSVQIPNTLLCVIVDGIPEAFSILRVLLFGKLSGKTTNIVQRDAVSLGAFSWIKGQIPNSKTPIDFILILKDRHGGKRDSIALFLELVLKSMEGYASSLPNFDPALHQEGPPSPQGDRGSLPSLADQQQLSFLIVDADCTFNSKFIHILFQKLWLAENSSHYAASPALRSRFSHWTDSWRLAQDVGYQKLNEFYWPITLNTEKLVTSNCVIGLQAGGLFKCSYVLDSKVVREYGREGKDFLEAMSFNMNEDTYLSVLIRHKNPTCLFVPTAILTTVLPDCLDGYLNQKRRWRNGNMIHLATLGRDSDKAQKNASWWRKGSRKLKKLGSLASSLVLNSTVSAFYFYALIILSSFGYTHFEYRVKAAICAELAFGITTILCLRFRANGTSLVYRSLGGGSSLLSLFAWGAVIYNLVTVFIIPGVPVVGTGAPPSPLPPHWISLALFLLTWANPLVYSVAMLIRRKADRFFPLSLVYELFILAPISSLILNTYCIARFDDLSWGNVSIPNSKVKYTQQIVQEGKTFKTKKIRRLVFVNLLSGLILPWIPGHFLLFYLAIAALTSYLGILGSSFLNEDSRSADKKTASESSTSEAA